MSKEKVRALMPPDMLTIADEAKELLGARMTYLKVGDVEFGTPGERGLSLEHIVLLDWERKQKQIELERRKVASRGAFKAEKRLIGD